MMFRNLWMILLKQRLTKMYVCLSLFCCCFFLIAWQFLIRLIIVTFLKEINEILGEKLSAEDEEEILAEFENLETQVCVHFQLATKLRCVGQEYLILYLNYIYSFCPFLIHNFAQKVLR